MSQKPNNDPGKIFVVSTSHLDWDWSVPFENYYASGYYSNSNGILSVSGILYTAIQLILSSKHLNPQQYKYNLAEAGWMKRFLEDFPEFPSILATLKGSFYFLGGGITSPDNLVCNGEAFIRNYLVGRSYIKKMGMGELISDVCWIPDDYGHDPQLPVVLKAMNMKGVSFARVNGNAPSVSANTPLDTSRVSIDTLLKQHGVAFRWKADDGSEIVASFMYDFPGTDPGYGVVWDQLESDVPSKFDAYVTATVTAPHGGSELYKHPGNLYMAPCGGDFSTPAQLFLNQVNAYNAPGGNSTNTVAVMSTFEDYLAELEYKMSHGEVLLKTYTGFDTSNFWTGYFSSRVQLKINQQRSVNRLLAAETLSTLLRCYSGTSTAALGSLNQLIDTAWDHIAPGTHHDFITGTSGDPVYWQEQMPLSKLVLHESETALDMAMHFLAGAMQAPTAAGVSYVVFNPSGFDRQVGTLAEIPQNSLLPGSISYTLQDQSTGPVQRLKNGNMIVPLSNVNSMGYQCITLATTVNTPVPVKEYTEDSLFILENEYLRVTIEKEHAWAISDLYDKVNKIQMVTDGQLCNQILVVSEGGCGNLYQMGNELTPNSGSGFNLSSATGFSGVSGEMMEHGPYLHHFSGTISNDTCGTYTVEYFLAYNEPMIRMRITGQASDTGTNAMSVVTSWNLQDANSAPPTGMQYGTPNHWNDPAKHADEAWGFTPYWNGPTFRSTHDYITLTQSAGADPLGAVYHEGMRSWTLYNNQLMGILFRNAANGQRGAAGYDLDTHTQNFAFRIQGVGAPGSCQPLQESISFQQPLLAAEIGDNNICIGSMLPTGQLASVSSPALIRVARTQPGSGGVATINNSGTSSNGNNPPFSFVLRVYQPTNIAAGNWNITIPCLTSQAGTPALSFVTALEEELAPVQNGALQKDVLSLSKMDTLTTLRVQAFNPPLYTCAKPNQNSKCVDS